MRKTFSLKVVGATALVLAGILGGAMPVPAQQQLQDGAASPDVAEPAVSPPAPSRFGENVVVTASAVTEERAEVPVSVAVIDAEEIEARQAPSLADLVASVPGVSVAMAGPPGQQTSVFVRGAESDQTLLLWNGVELNSPYFGAVNWQFMGSEGVERVEVLRGPASALYGGNAVGGVVQVLSGLRDGGQVRLEGGEDGYYRAGVAAGHDFGSARIDVAGSSRRGDSEFENGFFDGDELVAKLGWEPSANASLGVLARVDDSETGIPFSFGVPNSTARIAWRERVIALPFSAELGSWTIAGQLSHLESEYGFRDPEDPFGSVSSDTDSQGERGRVVASYRKSEGLWFAVGAESERLEVTDTTNFGTNLDSADQSTWAGFGELNYELGRAHFDVGLRHDDSDAFGSETSLRAGVSLRLTEGSRLKAHYGEAFRPPTLGELFFPFFGNPNLEPEHGESYELSWGLDRGAWRLEVSAFELDQQDLIDFDVVASQLANVSRARSRGLEGSVGWGNEWVELRANATYLEAKNLDRDTDLLRRPQESANLFATVKPGRFTVTTAARFVGERPDFDAASGAPVINPSYLRLDLGARFAATARIAPYARVENLTDRRYEEVAGYPAQGRTVVGGLTVGF